MRIDAVHGCTVYHTIKRDVLAAISKISEI